ncbi:unnamed protein product [Adineta steineri]|uniref:Uncharacterized protein n=1 Tax=Adineta steineri TaxID=433720 RepID=A0A815TGF2_9BILA|nr:unnamed protein product [Adineta steineri]
MAKWQIITQNSGITDAMRINILNALRISIDTHGSSKVFEISEDVKNWLDESYGKYWCVIIGNYGEWSGYYHYFGGKRLRINEVDLKWRIDIFEQAS